MTVKSLTYTLAIIGAVLACGHQASAQGMADIGSASSSHSFANVDGSIRQFNNADDAELYTLIGSSRTDDPNAGRVSSIANVGGDVLIHNSAGGDNATLDTLVGSVSTRAPVRDMAAYAFIEGDLTVLNTAQRARMTTDIGSVDSMENAASASAHVKGEVVHSNTGNDARSTLLVGSLKGADYNRPR